MTPNEPVNSVEWADSKVWTQARLNQNSEAVKPKRWAEKTLQGEPQGQGISVWVQHDEWPLSHARSHLIHS